MDKSAYINFNILENNDVMNEWYIGDTNEWPIQFDIKINGNNTGETVTLNSYEEVDEYCMKYMESSNVSAETCAFIESC